MQELNKQLNFSAFDILLCVISVYLLVTGNGFYIIDFIYYIKSLTIPWLIIASGHLLAFYFVLSDLQFEIRYRPTIKFNLKYILF
jgi:hypothetical protein